MLPSQSSTAPSGRPLSPTKQAAQEPFMPLLREFVRAYQTFTTVDEQNIRKLGLTAPQFDVICTLGNTPGMLMGQLAEKTLVTKGTLTGIVDRLEAKGLVQRVVPPDNRRCFMIVLTPAGKEVFERVFPAHIAHLKQRFGQLSDEEMQTMLTSLKRLREIFST